MVQKRGTYLDVELATLLVFYNASQGLTNCIKESRFSDAGVPYEGNLEPEVVIVVFLESGVARL